MTDTMDDFRCPWCKDWVYGYRGEFCSKECEGMSDLYAKVAP